MEEESPCHHTAHPYSGSNSCFRAVPCWDGPLLTTPLLSPPNVLTWVPPQGSSSLFVTCSITYWMISPGEALLKHVPELFLLTPLLVPAIAQICICSLVPETPQKTCLYSLSPIHHRSPSFKSTSVWPFTWPFHQPFCLHSVIEHRVFETLSSHGVPNPTLHWLSPCPIDHSF